MKKVYRTVEISQSLNIADVIEPQGCFCWRNAVRALRTPSLHLSNAKYVEGVFITPDLEYGGDFHIPHGWLELEDGTILDPTFVYFPELSRCDYYQDDIDQKYVPNQYYSLTDLDGVTIEDLPISKHTYL